MIFYTRLIIGGYHCSFPRHRSCGAQPIRQGKADNQSDVMIKQPIGNAICNNNQLKIGMHQVIRRDKVHELISKIRKQFKQVIPHNSHQLNRNS